MDTSGPNFIEQIIEHDNATGKHGGRVVTRFPPEPNGYLHIGHAKAIGIDFGLAEKYGGKCHLRFDDTNPLTESEEYTRAIQRDIRWLGYDWGENLFYASDYFDALYEWAEGLIRDGKAYVCSLSPDEISEWRGTFTVPGRNSPYRDRTIEENLDLFRRMKAGEFPDSAHTLRAKIDMAHPNPNMRDPSLYRIRHAKHHHAGDKWCIYPLYDYAHPLSDAIEGVTHSLCSLEFENRRPLYDWVIESCRTEAKPQQIEFARLKLSYTVMSKRKLLKLVREGRVSGWDDPRMPTLAAFRRRGYTPASIRGFIQSVGVSKSDSLIDVTVLENAIREDLNENAPRAMAVLRPLELEIVNWEGEADEVDVPNHPQKPELGKRKVPFGRRVWIEADDFLEDPPKKFFRLAPGREVRLRSAYYVTCVGVEKDALGRVIKVLCTYDPQTRGGGSPDGRKVKGTLHWAPGDAPTATVRVYDRLFSHERPDEVEDFETVLNPDSLQVIEGARIEPSLTAAEPGTPFQFERLGYFVVDTVDSQPGKPVFNRTVTLRDSWAKVAGD